MARPRVQSKDKWKSKVWYQILAPEMFGEKEVGETPASDPKKVIGRIIRVPVNELTGNHRQGNMALFFKVDKVAGTTAKTKVSGFEVMRTYLHSIIRRNCEKLDIIRDLKTKDGVKLRVKAIIITSNLCYERQKKALTGILNEIVNKEVEDNDFETFLKHVIEHQIQKAVKKASNVILPVSHVEIRKIELL